jgi:hypothetical protein
MASGSPTPSSGTGSGTVDASSRGFPDGRGGNITQTRLDDPGSRIRTDTTIHENSDGTRTVSETKTSYNDKGDLGRSTDYQKTGPNGELLDKGRVEYDERGNVVNREGNTAPIEQDDPELGDEDPEKSGKETKCPGADAPPGPDSSMWDDVWAFGKGVLEGAAVTLLAAGAVALAAAVPVIGGFLAPALALGLLAWGLYGAYQTIQNWAKLSTADKAGVIGNIVGGLLAGGMLRPRAPRLPPEELPAPRASGSGEGAPPSPKRPPRIINVDDLPHNEFLDSQEYLDGWAKGAPELKPVGPNGGGFLDAQAGPIEGPKTLYRVGNETGSWWSDQPPPDSIEAWRQRDGVIPKWNPHPKEVQTITIPPGEQIPMGWKGGGAPAYDLKNGVTYKGGPPQYNIDPSGVPPGWKSKFTPTWKP